MTADFDETSASYLVGNELGAVGGDPDEAAPSLTFALGEIVGQPREDIAEFPPQIALELKDHRAEQRVGPTMYLGKPDFLIDRKVVGAKRVMQ
jgi:hypothetical protein